MSVELLTLLFFGSLLVFLLLGTPLAFVLGGVSVVFLYFEMGEIGFYLLASKMWETMQNPTLMAIPLFVFMAILLEKSGVANDLYDMMHQWWGGLRGGLAIGTVLICVIFAAMSGISGAAVVTMGTIALPKMLERGYDKKLALGAINAGGGWGILIPPSILMVLYALLTEVSVGRLFAAGVGPGLTLFVLVSLYIGGRCWLQPDLGPALPPEERADWGQKFRSLRAVILPILIVTIVLGAIFGGFATATEAAAIGVFGALFATGVNGQLSWKVIHEASIATMKLTALIIWILFAAHAFSTAYTALGAQSLISDLMAYIPGGRWGALAFMLMVLFFFGMVLDPVGIMLITLPVFLPVVQQAGFDPIWFGILFIIMMEVGYMTPPFGFNLFYLKGVAPPDVTMGDIYASVIPYVIVTLIGVLLIILFPGIALYLPNLFYN
ncbi:TRAP transporter large permease subunit [Sulfitobacter pseudonitzschiae]|jgi:tripartite ATP-independent transporter DctM subunit|uniref:TRAP transporter large permease protein n=1 Tax=Pseudosulfitobacter pseudonitzschiae TaxID=1402135 RepID=A0A9Q2NKD5_9RHOB|nr:MULTISPECIES: TRAP transporter large permease subunit [Roseobacteraceae]MBM2292899.1 TRAP transporter large permease subunit [Pseudosulfitobacter pseudonitzschiae]MBM2298573.1 TRAP transporter large permease subunit [Pseudosulfitobacter pseudonitzschiae]MBM2303487.1 TRAP transporter large permease subunit [Pseudosulfitobacter pseudonitzschiae]MBM2313270.1 TRAP transporter large permease subunit [Pseudosulfitobacter pseudonitzschiae]MBM2318183.1 TRAP transporter large permease subunit [Pseud|tara:strand:+ start:1301 stop:2614 length:1314 start_codon:yes stop_codon:yes gene_type:complete